MWCLVEILKLMQGRDSGDVWSRFVFQFLIWPQDVTLVRWTQPSGLLCLWQCFFYSYYFFVFKHGVIWIDLFLAFFFSDFQQHRDLSISVIVHLLNKFKTNWAIAFVNVYVGSCNYPSALPSQSILREFWLMTKICLDQDHLELGSFEIWCGSLRIRPYHQFWSHQGLRGVI